MWVNFIAQFILTNVVYFQLFTGTGKTATFSISILQQIDTSLKECQALILAPTRELAQQVSVSSGRRLLQQKYYFLFQQNVNMFSYLCFPDPEGCYRSRRFYAC